MAKQLIMTLQPGRFDSSLQLSLPAGYLLRDFQNDDKADYVKLMKSTGFNEWNDDSVIGVIEKVIPNGLFFIEHIESSEIVGTAVGTKNPTKYSPNGGELGWVAANPSHCRKGLGYILCAAVTKRFLELGYREIYLLTDDFRLTAIKIYLKLGYIPLYQIPDMKQRWKNIFEKLNLEYADYQTLK